MKIRILILALLVLVDQVSKLWASAALASEAYLTVIPKFLEFRYSENTGMAFSLLAEYYLALTCLVGIFVLALIVYCFRQKSLAWPLVFMIAGGLGNLIDRGLHGYVIDFINFLFVDFAIFNVADIYLNIAAGLIIWQLWKSEKNRHCEPNLVRRGNP